MKCNVVCNVNNVKERQNITHWLLLILPIFFILPFIITGIIRFFTGISIQDAIFPAFSVVVLFFILFIRHAYRAFTFQIKETVFFLLSWLPIVFVVFYSLYNSSFHGLVSIGGGDAGMHVFQEKIFLITNPKEYNGFIGLYSLHGWLRYLFSIDIFKSYKISFYFMIMFLTIIPPFYWYYCSYSIKISSAKSHFFNLLIGLSFSIICYFYILSPILHYHQADGFYPHIFSIIFILFLWITYGCISHPIFRMITLAFIICILRFTYALNLADFLLSLAAALIIESIDYSNKKWFRSLCFLGILPIIGASIYAITKILPILNWTGGFVPQKMYLLSMTLIFSAFFVCFLSYQIFYSSEKTKKMVWLRHAMVPAILCICACLHFFIIIISGKIPQYFTYKYMLGAQIISMIAIISFLPSALGCLWKYNSIQNKCDLLQEKFKLNKIFQYMNDLWKYFCVRLYLYLFVITMIVTWCILTCVVLSANAMTLTFSFEYTLILLIVCILIPIFFLYYIYSRSSLNLAVFTIFCTFALFTGNLFSTKNYHSSFRDRLKQIPPWSKIFPLSDSIATEKISSILKQENKTFSGYIHPFWPQINFVNAYFGSDRGWQIISEGAINESPNSCVFWADSAYDREQFARFKTTHNFLTADTVDKLSKNELKTCYTYQIPQNQNTFEKLCWICL